MTDASADLASLLCSRLCHDLMSPVGALSNGLELLSDEADPAMRQRCLDLLEQSARTSIDKLRVFRVAFGAAGSLRDEVPAAEARALVLALAGSPQRITVDWAVAAEALPKAAVKTLLNLALIGVDALVRGGTLAIGAELSPGGCEIVVRAAGPRVAFDPEIGRALEQPLGDAALTSRTAAAAMVQRLAAALDGRVRVAHAADALVLGAELRLAPAPSPAPAASDA